MNDNDPATAPTNAAPELTATRYPIVFNGSGGEYFRIWIVNLLLTILTLGIYSAWAKVRKLQYFYRNTEVDGSVFDYHGRPGAILKGRIVALLLIGFYNFAFQFSLALGLFAVALMAALLPWLLTQSQKFRLHNSSYRGLRFRFTGLTREAYLIFGLPLLLALVPTVALAFVQPGHPPPNGLLIGFGFVLLAFTLLVPYLHYRIKRFQHAHAHFGRSASRFHGKARQFYWIYAQALLLLVALGILVALAVGAVAAGGAPRSKAFAATIGLAVAFVLYGAMLCLTPFINARVQNRVWNSTLLGLVGFESNVRARRLVFIYVTNLLLIVVTLGLFIPFAVVRMLKYRLASVTVLSTSDLQGFVAHQAQREVGATGEGAADLLDFDFAL